ncbi:MAG: hypothetical protein FJ271_12100 [Planctomycetes bacterium]|nr:hypothetical protein [Planctomycetota bacterium]
MHKTAATMLVAVVLAMATVTGLTGCGEHSPASTTTTADTSPLSLEDWRKITEAHIRHDPDTLERLKKGNLDLQTQEGWEAFEREELTRAGN